MKLSLPRLVSLFLSLPLCLAMFAPVLSHAQEQTKVPGPPAIYKSCQVTKPVIALTFDDGPTSALTPQLLDILKAHGARATLFVIGKRADQSPELLQRAVAEGNEIGNHTWSHANLTKISTQEMRAEVQDAADAIFKATGKRPELVRPPYLGIDGDVIQFLHGELGLKIISCNIDSLDWRDHNSAKTTENIVTKAAPGAIVLCHETEPSTLAALPGILDALKAKGYEFVTVSEMISMEKPH